MYLSWAYPDIAEAVRGIKFPSARAKPRGISPIGQGIFNGGKRPFGHRAGWRGVANGPNAEEMTVIEKMKVEKSAWLRGHQTVSVKRILERMSC